MCFNVFKPFVIRRFFQKNCFVLMLASIALITACGSNTPQPSAPSQPTPLQTLNARVTNLENQARLLREIQEELKGVKSNIIELKRLKEEVQELGQLERNQNKLFLEYQEKFEERIAQIEQNLDRNNFRVPRSAGKDSSGEPISSVSIPPSASSSHPPPSPPAGAEQLFESGLALHTAKQYLKSIQVFQQLRKDYPDHPNAIEGHYLIGDAYFSLQDYQNAAIAFYEFTEQNPQYPNNFDAKWKLAQSLEKSGEIGLALDIYQEMTSQENSPYREQAQEKLKIYEKQSQ